MVGKNINKYGCSVKVQILFFGFAILRVNVSGEVVKLSVLALRWTIA